MNSPRASLVAVGVVFMLIGTTAMVLRVLSSVSRKRKAGYDDYAIWMAYLASLGFAAASFDSIRWGVGLPAGDLPPSWAIACIQALYAVEVSYFIALYFTKLSVLLVYFRLASELKNILYRGSQIVTAALTLHFVASIVATAVQCVPLQRYFNPEIPGHCINITAFLYSSNGFTIVTDLIMMGLPLSTIWKASLSRGQKVAVTCAFLAGGISTLASCIRLYSIRIYTLSDDRIRDAAPINIWSFVELYIAICCASIAAIKPLFSRSHRRISSPTTSGGFGMRPTRHCKHRAHGQALASSDTANDYDVPDHVFTCELNRQLSTTKPLRSELSMSNCRRCGQRCSKSFVMDGSAIPNDHQHVLRSAATTETKFSVDSTEKEVV